MIQKAESDFYLPRISNVGICRFVVMIGLVHFCGQANSTPSLFPR